uniref:Isoform 2 of Methenyltetrahydrofolate synthase domain-containing protein n=1 Tax=Xenopus laevis TaxID=8355 RepID=Q52L34-2
MEPGIRVDPGCSKWDIRQKVWDYIENNNLADFPRPVHHRIPNFKGASQACDKLSTLKEFQAARIVKINPDTPQKRARFLTLEARKTLLVPTPRLRTGLFNKITPPPGANKEVLRICSTSQGVKDYSVPMGLDAKVQVDLVVVGSVAVSVQGWRIGKGEGFADMEYAMMVSMGAVTEHTVVVTVVHDCQVVDIPEELLEDHDLTVDFILTPTRIIKTDCKRAKPQGIIWSMITREMMGKIPILRNLQDRERRAGKDVSLKDGNASEQGSRQSPLCLPEKELGPCGSVLSEHKHLANAQLHTKLEACNLHDGATVYIGDIPSTTRVSELKSMLRERGAAPLRLTWQGAQHRAFLDYRDVAQAKQALSSLEGISINGISLLVELARTQRPKANGNQGFRNNKLRATNPSTVSQPHIPT